MTAPKQYQTGIQTLTNLLGKMFLQTDNGGPVPTRFQMKTGTFVANGNAPVVVADTDVDAGTMIIITLNTPGGTVGAMPIVQTKTAGTGFTVNAAASDTSIYNYTILG